MANRRGIRFQPKLLNLCPLQWTTDDHPLDLAIDRTQIWPAAATATIPPIPRGSSSPAVNGTTTAVVVWRFHIFTLDRYRSTCRRPWRRQQVPPGLSNQRRSSGRGSTGDLDVYSRSYLATTATTASGSSSRNANGRQMNCRRRGDDASHGQPK